jgi:hypothetical protein
VEAPLLLLSDWKWEAPFNGVGAVVGLRSEPGAGGMAPGEGFAGGVEFVLTCVSPSCEGAWSKR